MQSTVKTFETADHTYYIGYGMTAKTTYEQQQERKEDIKRMTQKAIMIIGLIGICIIFSLISLEFIIPVVSIGLLGISAIITDNICI